MRISRRPVHASEVASWVTVLFQYVGTDHPRGMINSSCWALSGSCDQLGGCIRGGSMDERSQPPLASKITPQNSKHRKVSRLRKKEMTMGSSDCLGRLHWRAGSGCVPRHACRGGWTTTQELVRHILLSMGKCLPMWRPGWQW